MTAEYATGAAGTMGEQHQRAERAAGMVRRDQAAGAWDRSPCPSFSTISVRGKLMKRNARAQAIEADDEGALPADSMTSRNCAGVMPGLRRRSHQVRQEQLIEDRPVAWRNR